MGKRKQIEFSVNELIINHFQKGKSYQNIGKALNLSCASVQNIRKYKTYKTEENRTKTGRPRKLSRRGVSLMLKEVDKTPKISAPKLADSIAVVSGKRVHSKTVTLKISAPKLADSIAVVSGKRVHSKTVTLALQGHAVDRNSLLTLNNYMRTQTFYDAVNLSFIAELIGQQDVIKMVPPSNCITPFFIQTMNAFLMCVNYHM
ncbi:hypothetical protein QE152_g32527 [Popillia japonica]|uniref:Uncharacterized protein n=1 Tax=Popillia japonica TaxID=7064 RepID=A0AAW1IZI5_POPJA